MDLDHGFTSMLDDARTQSLSIGDYIRGKRKNSSSGNDSGPRTQRYWMIPSRAGTFTPTDIANLGTAFTRTELNQEYEKQLHGGASGAKEGKMGNVIADGIQLAYMSMWERSFRERHKTDVRMQLHLATRRVAHGDEVGIHTGCIKKYTQTFIDNVANV